MGENEEELLTLWDWWEMKGLVLMLIDNVRSNSYLLGLSTNYSMKDRNRRVSLTMWEIKKTKSGAMWIINLGFNK